MGRCRPLGGYPLVSTPSAGFRRGLGSGSPSPRRGRVPRIWHLFSRPFPTGAPLAESQLLYQLSYAPLRTIERRRRVYTMAGRGGKGYVAGPDLRRWQGGPQAAEAALGEASPGGRPAGGRPPALRGHLTETLFPAEQQSFYVAISAT